VSVDSIAEKAFNPVGAGDAFMNYADDFQAKNDVKFKGSFQGKAKSINRRNVRTVTKVCLDNNFEISILGGEKNIERGYNQKRRQKYYTLYFDKEK
jgi:hypothetical protein